MEPVRIITGTAVPLDRSDVDTDQIIPSDWLKQVERTGFDKGLFSEWRDERDFVLNREEFQGATILVAGPNFGTGSSREHAVWAIQQYGFAAVVSPRFGDIFRNNATKNGLVPVQVSEELGRRLLAEIEANPRLELVVDADEAVGQVLPVVGHGPAPLRRERLVGVGVEGLLALEALALEAVVEGQQEPLLAAEVVVQEREVRAGLLSDVAGREGLVAVAGEDRERGVEDRVARRALGLLLGDLDRLRHLGSSGDPAVAGRRRLAETNV